MFITIQKPTAYVNATARPAPVPYRSEYWDNVVRRGVSTSMYHVLSYGPGQNLHACRLFSLAFNQISPVQRYSLRRHFSARAALLYRKLYMACLPNTCRLWRVCGERRQCVMHWQRRRKLRIFSICEYCGDLAQRQQC